MNLVRRTWAATVASWLAVSLLGCSGHRAASGSGQKDGTGFETLELRYQGFAGVVSYPELAEDLGYLAPIKLKYVGNTISGPQDIQTVVTGDTDFGGAFNGAVVKLVAAKAPVEAVVGYYGVDDQTFSGYFVLTESAIHSARDLIGKKVGVNTIGAHHEFVLHEWLSRNGLSKTEIEQVTLVAMPPVTSEQALRQKQVDVAVLNNLMRDKALERGNVRQLFSDFEMLGKFTAGSYVLTKAFLRDNPKSAERFVVATAKAIEWAREQPRDQVIARFEDIINRRARNEDASALKYWRTTGVAGKGGLIADREFQIWLDWLVKDGQLSAGQLQPRDLFTNDLNPFHGTSPT